MAAAACVVVGLVTAHRSAEACTCADSRVIGYVWPPDLSVDVPRDVLVLVVAEPGRTIELRQGPNVISTAQAGLWERVLAATGETWSLLRPMELLDPGAFEIVVNGEVWSRFTVGSALDEEPPSFAGLSAAEGVYVPVSPTSSCAGEAVSRLELTYDDAPDDVAYTILRLREPGQEAFFETPLTVRPGDTPYAGARILENTWCSPAAPTLVAGDTYCATLTAYDGSGNSAGGETEHCFVTTQCEPAPSSFNPACVEAAPRETGGCGVGTAGSSWLLLLVAAVLLQVRGRQRRG